MARWELWRLDTDRRRLGVAPIKRAELSLRWCAPSRWTVTTLDGAAALAGERVLITRDQQTVLSGVATDRMLALDPRGGRRVTLEGVDDVGRIDEFLAYPDPTLDADDQSQPNRDDRSGPVGELIRGYLDDNIGPASLRPLDGLELPDTGDVDGLGDTVRGRLRYAPLADALKSLVERAGGSVEWTAVQPIDATTIQVAIRETRDRPGVVFDLDGMQAAGILKRAEIETRRPRTTVGIAGGPGEGADRLVVARADQDAVGEWGRIETWLDRRNAGDDDADESDIVEELEDEIDELLADGQATVDITLTLANVPAVGWPDRWRLGDRVKVRVDGEEQWRRVRGVDLTVDADGERLQPRLGSPQATQVMELARRLGEVEADTARAGRG